MSTEQQKTVRQTLFILQNLSPHSWEEKYSIAAHDMSKSETFAGQYVCLGEHEVEVSIPADVNPAALAITALERHRDSVREQMMQKIAVIDERIESIRCIEYKPEA